VSGHKSWEQVKAERGLATGAIVTPEQVISPLKRALAQRWDADGRRTIDDLLRLLNGADQTGIMITGVVEDATDGGDHQVFAVSWYNGQAWCERRIVRGSAEWELDPAPTPDHG
jgi:hypothetical protein